MPKYDQFIGVKVTAAQKEFVDSQGGSQFVRLLIESKMKKCEQEETIEAIVLRYLANYVPTIPQPQSTAAPSVFDSHTEDKVKKAIDALFS